MYNNENFESLEFSRRDPKRVQNVCVWIVNYQSAGWLDQGAEADETKMQEVAGALASPPGPICFPGVLHSLIISLSPPFDVFLGCPMSGQRGHCLWALPSRHGYYFR